MWKHQWPPIEYNLVTTFYHKLCLWSKYNNILSSSSKLNGQWVLYTTYLEMYYGRIKFVVIFFIWVCISIISTFISPQKGVLSFQIIFRLYTYLGKNFFCALTNLIHMCQWGNTPKTRIKNKNPWVTLES